MKYGKNQTLDRPKGLGLINTCDAYVSLQKTEGFGQILAEVMLLGKPAVTTRYLGNLGFMSHGGISLSFKDVNFALDDYEWISFDDKAKWVIVDVANAVKKMKDTFSINSISKKIQKTLD